MICMENEGRARMAAGCAGAPARELPACAPHGPRRAVSRRKPVCGQQRDGKDVDVPDLRGAGPARLSMATGAASRMRGLLLSQPGEGALLLMPCGDVHTVGMRRRLDIAFVDDGGRVIESHRDVGPMRRLRNRRAAAVIERFSSCSSPWFAEVDRLGIVCWEEVGA